MDDMNISDLNRLVKDSDRSKVKKLLSFTGSTRSIADPWFTGNFDETYNDVLAGCTELLKTL
jgi:protein-tyrosine phosphatase